MVTHHLEWGSSRRFARAPFLFPILLNNLTSPHQKPDLSLQSFLELCEQSIDFLIEVIAPIAGKASAETAIPPPQCFAQQPHDHC